MPDASHAPNTTQITYLVIYNEQSGIAYYDHKKAIQKFLNKHNISCTIHNTTPDGSFLDINPNNFERIIVAGGDGTVREVANWILKSKSTTPLVLIPRGSGNILASTLNIPFNTIKALELAITGSVKKIDAGLINKKDYFFISAGMGFDAKIMKNTSRQMKRVFGIYAYIEGVIKAFLNFHVDKFFIKSEGYENTVKAQAIFVSVVPEIVKLKTHPQSKFNDGNFNVSIIGTVSALDFFKLAINVLRNKHEKDWRLTFFKTKRIYILPLTKQVPMQVDGDIVYLPYMDIEMIPEALSIVTNKIL